jgi:antitoxin Phd
VHTLLARSCYNQTRLTGYHKRCLRKPNNGRHRTPKINSAPGVDAVQKGKAQVVTRRGVPTVVVVSIEEFEKFHRFEAAQAPSFINLLLSMPTDDGEFKRMNVQLRDFE